MARKRLNTKFLIIGLGVVVLGMGALAIEYKFQFRKRLLLGPPDQLIAEGKALMEAGEYEKASDKLYAAGTVRRSDPQIYVLIGDLWDLRMGEDPQTNLGKSRGFWEQALTIDPRYLPALERILNRNEQIAEIEPTPNAFQALRESAERYLVVEPDDKRAQYLLHMATLQLKRSGGQVDAGAVEESLRAMKEMQAADVGNDDALMLVAENRIAAAHEAYRGNDDATMRALLSEVAGMAEAAVQAQPNNAALHLRAAQIYYGISGLERLARGDHEPWKLRGKESLSRARELVKPGDENYRDVQSHYAENVLLAENKVDEAEKVYRDLMQRDPKDYLSRLRLADLVAVDPQRRDEAVQLLSVPLPPIKEQKGLDAYLTREFEVRSLLVLLDVRLKDYLTLKTPEERQPAMAKIEQDYNRVRTLRGDRPDVMQVYGRIQIGKGDLAGAVKTLNASLNSSERQLLGTRLHTMDLLARCYTMTGQSGLAKRTLGELIAHYESLPDGEQRGLQYRLMLITHLLEERNPNDAKAHVAILEKHLKPEDPRLIVARLGVMTDPAQKDERKKLFDQLPQETRAQILEKARLASRVMEDDETALRLLEGLRATDPADIDVVVNLADFYLSKNKKDQAERVIADALAKAPDNLQLQMAQKRLAADTPEEVQALRQEAIESITDPFRKELRLFEVAMNENRADQARVHLTNAEKMKPDDTTVIDMLYRFHASQKEFDRAQQYLDRLAQKDPGRGEIERINLALARGDSNQALELANKLTRDRGEFAVSHLRLAQVHESMGRYPEAVNAYRSALERDSRNLDALMGLVGCYYRLGQPSEARRHIETARRIYPNHARVRELALAHETEYGDPEQAIAPRQQQLNDDKENPANWIALGRVYLAAYRAKANAGKEADGKAHLAKAEDLFKQGIAKWPDSAEFAAALAQVALQLKKYDDGVKVLTALGERPNWKDRHEPKLLLADFLMAAGRDAEAEAVYRKLLDETKDLGLQLRLTELILRQPERVDEALAVLELNAQEPMVQRQRIDVLLRAGRTDEAQKALDAMAAAPPPAGLSDADQKRYQGMLADLQAAVYIGANKPVEAMEAVNKALSLDPQQAMALYRRGLLRLNTRGDAAGAIEDFTAARRVAPGMVEVRLELAKAHRARNDIESAMRELETAVRDVPTDKRLRLALVGYYTESVPPRWGEAERIFRESREIPMLARDVDLLQAEARMWSARNDMQRAVRTIQEASQAAPQNLSVISSLLEILNKGRQHKEVLNITDRLAKSNPNVWWAYQARGVAKCRMDDKDGALLEFEQGLKIAEDERNEMATQSIISTIAQELGSAAAMRRVEPKAADSPRWKMVAAKLLLAQADYSGALRYVQQVMDDPSVSERDRSTAMRLAGELYCNQSPPDFAKAMDIFKKLVDQNPEDVGALNNLAAVMTMPGSPARPEDALQYSQKAYDIMNRTGTPEAAILDTHGAILVQVGRVDEGVSLLQAAIDRKPLPDAYYHLGDALLRQSKPDEAENALRRARDLIAQAERDKLPVDPTLRQRVEEALIRASALKQQKTSGAQ